MPYATNPDDDTRIYYEVSGTGEPVICIHGALIADTFRPMLAEPKLVDRYQLILYHRRGYANSSRVFEPVSIARQAADGRALLRHLNLGPAHVVGHSYGGVVALQFALDAPEMVRSLALLEPALMVGSSAEDYRASLATSVERYREVGTATVVEEFLQARCPEYETILDRRLPGAFEQAVRDASTAFECELPGVLDWEFGELEARRISQQVLSVLGGQSDVLSPRFGETHQLLLRWLPHADGYVLPGATHFHQLEDPRGMAEALLAFWTRHSIATRVR